MAVFRAKWRILISRSTLFFFNLLMLAPFLYVFAERSLKNDTSGSSGSEGPFSNYLLIRAANVPPQSNQTGYHHVWPEINPGWRIVVGSIIGFFGAACGSVGGVGGGGIFVPMLSLIIGFDSKSATAISKCMITGAASSTVYYNLKLRHPTLDLPIIDYNLALLIQPMLMLGISIGVAFNVIFADWMLTVLLIVLFVVISTKACIKGVETWKKETILLKVDAKLNLGGENAEVESNPLPSGTHENTTKKPKVTVFENVYWMEFGLLVFVWVAFLGIQIAKIPVSISVSLYEAIGLYKGRRLISSRGDQQTHPRVHQLVLYCVVGVLAGILGGLLGLGGGFIMVPLFLEIGVPPQVSSATATFAMTFSSSMAVVEYYLLKRVPVPYAMYFVAVATLAALVGQQIVRRIIILFGRASLIIFILAVTIFASAIFLGGVGISNMIRRIERHEYMGFENLCKYG